MFIGGNARIAVNEGRGDFTPIFLSEIPLLFRRNILNLDVALIQVKAEVSIHLSIVDIINPVMNLKLSKGNQMTPPHTFKNGSP